VAEGTPEDVAGTPASYTGEVLAPVLARAGPPQRLRPAPTRRRAPKAAKTAERVKPAKAPARSAAAGKRRRAG
jgi:excinuclease ABC subunit A